MKRIILVMFASVVIISVAHAQEKIKDDPFESALPQRQEAQPGAGEHTTAIAPPSISIEGVLWGTSIPQAIINGDVYKVGDTLKDLDAKIYKIEKNRIFIFYGGKLFEMNISKKEAK